MTPTDTLTYCRPEVLAFARLMEEALRRYGRNGGWKDEPDGFLVRRLREEVDELYEAMRDHRATIGAEAADVANFCMMIADNWGFLDDPH